jgi:hypothetical protein
VAEPSPGSGLPGRVPPVASEKLSKPASPNIRLVGGSDYTFAKNISDTLESQFGDNPSQLQSMNDFHQEVCERIDQIVDSTSQGRLTGLVGDANSQKQEIAKIMLYSQTYNKADTLLRVGDKAVVMEALDNLEGKLKQGAKLDQNNIKEIKQDAKKALNKVTPSQHRQEPG